MAMVSVQMNEFFYEHLQDYSFQQKKMFFRFFFSFNFEGKKISKTFVIETMFAENLQLESWTDWLKKKTTWWLLSPFSRHRRWLALRQIKIFLLA